MSHFWADWDAATHAPEIIRKDTRIYWSPQSGMNAGNCVGAFFGENPGSGRAASGLSHSGPAPIVDAHSLPGDPTLRLILKIWQLSVASGRKPMPSNNDFVEVLNTYYFRNGISGKSLAAWRSCGGSTIYNPAPHFGSRFVLLGWGVGHNASPEARAAAGLLAGHTRILVPNSKANVTVMSGATLPIPVIPASVAPSYILRRSKTLLTSYQQNVARSL